MGKRRHTARRVDTASPDWANLTRCPACGKKSFATKRAAKLASKVHHRSEHMSVYQCRSTRPERPTPAPWHYGHLDDSVISGELDRAQVYDEGRRVGRYHPDPQALRAIRQIASAPSNPHQ